MLEYKAPEKKSVTIEYGIEQVRNLLNKAGPLVLAAMYRTIAAQAAHSAIDPKVAKYWADEFELMVLMSDADVAGEMMRWFEKAIESMHRGPDGKMYVGLRGSALISPVTEWLTDVATEVMRVAKGGN